MVSKLLSLTYLLQKEIKQKPIIRYLLYFIALLPLYFFRDFTPSNELRYLSIADEAIRNQTWFTFSNHGEIYGDKPPLFFWLLILIRNLTGTYSMPLIGLISLLPAIGILWVMDQWIVRYAKRDDHPELISGILLFSTVYFLGSTFVIRMDMLMTFFIVLSLFIFYKMHQGEKTQKNKILFLSCIFMGAFTKGPSAIAVPIVSIVTFLAYKKQLKTICSYFSVLSITLFLLLGGCWVGMIYYEGGTAYLHNILIKQTIGRGINSFHHKKPFYYYLITSLYTFAPWTFLNLIALFNRRHSKETKTDLGLFFKIITISSFILFSLISSKLDIYLLPLYPFFIYYTGLQLKQIQQSAWVKASIALPAFILAFVFPALFLLPQYLPFPIIEKSYFLIGGAGLSIAAITALCFIRKSVQSSIISLGMGFLFFLFVSAFGLKQFNPYIGLAHLANQTKELTKNEPNVIYAYYRFRGGSDMDVFFGTSPVRIEKTEEVNAFFSKQDKALLFLSQKDFNKAWTAPFRNDPSFEFIPTGSYYIMRRNRQFDF